MKKTLLAMIPLILLLNACVNKESTMDKFKMLSWTVLAKQPIQYKIVSPTFSLDYYLIFNSFFIDESGLCCGNDTIGFNREQIKYLLSSVGSSKEINDKYKKTFQDMANVLKILYNNEIKNYTGTEFGSDTKWKNMSFSSNATIKE